MRFELSDEQQLLRNSVREFAEAELRPHVREWDDAQSFPRDVLVRCAELGLMGIQVAEEYGVAPPNTVRSMPSTAEYASISRAATRGGRTATR